MDLALAHHRLASSLAGQRLGHTIVYFPETGSTNDEARRLADEGHPEGVVVCTDHQTAGRGRRGAEWFSPPRKNLLLSVLLRPTLPTEQWPRLTHLAALAVCEGIEAVRPVLRPEVKWPNDIFLDGRKCAGLLLESAFPAQRPGFAVLGLGINVNLSSVDLPPDLRETTTSIAGACAGAFTARESLAAAILRALGRLLDQPASQFPVLLDTLRRRSCLLGTRVRAGVGGREIDALVHDLGPEGELLVRLSDDTILALSAVDWIRPAGQAAPRVMR